MAYSTISKPSLHFNTKLYTGNGGTQSVTGVGFKPDLTWIKSRSAADNHVLYDIVRGVQKRISINNTDAESTKTNGVTSFDSDGFTVGSATQNNGNSATFVAWNFLAGGSQGSSNTDGSINTTYTSVNTTAGFSISTYTGTGSNATVGHGLGAVPKMVIARNITDTEQWTTYHVGLDATAPQDYHIRMNTSDARVDEASVWNDTAPTSSVFSIGTSGAPNGNGDNHIAYCFAEKTGFSKFGSYTGNSDSNKGPFVYLGFKPAFVFLKNITNGNRGLIFDNKRIGYNPYNNSLGADVNLAEESASWTLIDLYSNGFRPKSNDGSQNASGNTYIYAAFAAEPLVANSGSNGVPATAR